MYPDRRPAIETIKNRERRAGEMGETYPWAEPPDRGAPVSPSDILGAKEEKDRETTARLAVDRGLMMDWRSMVMVGRGG